MPIQEDNLINKFGLVLEPISPKIWVGGENSPLKPQVINPSGSWLNDLVLSEYQDSSFACVSFSALSILEIIEKKITGREDNWSDKALLNMSGTVPKVGNTLYAVAQTITNRGYVRESMYPFKEPYFTTTPSEIIESCKMNAGKWNYQFIHRSQWQEALKSSPLQICIAFSQTIDEHGRYYSTKDAGINHAVCLLEINQSSNYVTNGSYVVYDSFPPYVKIIRWDTNVYEYAVQFIPKIKENNMEIPNNTLLQLVESPGGFGLFLDNQIIIDDLAKVLASWMVRNGGKIEKMTLPVKNDVWTAHPHIDLKGKSL